MTALRTVLALRAVVARRPAAALRAGVALRPGVAPRAVVAARRLTAALASAALVFAAGCGAEGDGGPESAAPTVGQAAGTAPGAAATDDDGVRGRAPGASRGIPAIVMLTPAAGGSTPDPAHPAAPHRGEAAVIDQFGLAFSPRALVVAAGEPVRFTNSEGALTHNVHVRSMAGDSTIFNGDAASGESLDVTLAGPGGYDVLCDVHPGMTAFVFATDAPYAVAAGADGSFTLGRLPPGEYVARVWTVDAGFGPERAVQVVEGTTMMDLTESAN